MRHLILLLVGLTLAHARPETPVATAHVSADRPLKPEQAPGRYG